MKFLSVWGDKFYTGGLVVGIYKVNSLGLCLTFTRAFTDSGEVWEKPSAVAATKVHNGPAPVANNESQVTEKFEYGENYNSKKLFKSAIRENTLKKAWLQLKSRPGILTPDLNLKTLDKISDK